MATDRLPAPSRRAFGLGLLAGLAACARGGGVPPEARRKTALDFAPYRDGETAVPVWRVTPPDGAYLHTYYDVQPFSPSGRYLAVTRLPFEHREPRAGELAEVCLIDLRERTIETVYRTAGWCLQRGAHLHWGADDETLFAAELAGGEGFAVRIDVSSGRARALGGPIYDVSPDARTVLGAPLELMNRSQSGYGVPDEPGWRDRFGALYATDALTGASRVVAPAAWFARRMGVPRVDLVHSSYNPQGDDILQVVRLPRGGGALRAALYAIRPDGTALREVMSLDAWARGANHPNWQPDGRRVVLNAVPPGDDTLRFCEVAADGSGFRPLSGRVGTGHMRIRPGGRWLVADAYLRESPHAAMNELPIRLLDLHADREEELCALRVVPAGRRVLRCDPHPEWDRTGERVAFIGMPEGRRAVFVADLSGLGAVS